MAADSKVAALIKQILPDEAPPSTQEDRCGLPGVGSEAEEL